MNRILLQAASLLAAASLAAPPAAAASHHKSGHQKAGHAAAPASVSTETLGSAGTWSAYVAHDSTGKVCFLAGQPRTNGSAGISRRQPLAMVTHRPAEHIADVVSFVEGAALKPGSVVTVAVGDRKFTLFTEGDGAWAKTADLDRTVVAALTGGTTATVKSEAANGRRTTDIYALAGFSQALDMIDKACGVGRPGAAAPAPHRTTVHRHDERHRTIRHRRHKAHEAAKPH